MGWYSGSLCGSVKLSVICFLVLSSCVAQPFVSFGRGGEWPRDNPNPNKSPSPLLCCYLRLIPSFRSGWALVDWRGRGFSTLKNLTCVCVANKSLVSFVFIFSWLFLLLQCLQLLAEFNVAANAIWAIAFLRFFLFIFNRHVCQSIAKPKAGKSQYSVALQNSHLHSHFLKDSESSKKNCKVSSLDIKCLPNNVIRVENVRITANYYFGDPTV